MNTTTTENSFDKYIFEARDRGDNELAARIKREKLMAKALVAACIKRGYQVSIHDGEGFAIRKSTDEAAILAAMFSTDEDRLDIWSGSFRDGWFVLVYGNDGWDVVSDYSYNAKCESIWNEVLRPLSDKLEAEAV